MAFDSLSLQQLAAELFRRHLSWADAIGDGWRLHVKAKEYGLWGWTYFAVTETKPVTLREATELLRICSLPQHPYLAKSREQ